MINKNLNNQLEKFLPYADDPNFYGAIVTNSYRLLYRHEGILNKAALFFSDEGCIFKVYGQSGLIVFESGAKIHLTRTDRVHGLFLDDVLLIGSPSTTREDILRVKSRLRGNKNAHENFWIININDV